MATLDDVRRICSAIPGTQEGDGRFGFSVTVKGKPRGFVWSWMERAHPKKPKIENQDVLAIRVPGEGAKETLVASSPERFADDPHYAGYPAVLARIALFGAEELEELLVQAAQCASAPTRRR